MKVAVVAAHPDDEVLGCGGTIAKHADAGDEVHILIMAEGITSRSSQRDLQKNDSALSAIAMASKKAGCILGAESVALMGFPDNRMDAIDLLDIIKEVENFIDVHKPEIIYTHHSGDLNIDHQIVHKAVVTACRPQSGSSVKTLLFFEIPSSTEWQAPCSNNSFIPNWFVDISTTIDIKIEALREYSSEMRPWPHPRSYEAVKYLASWRGATIGKISAESFVLGRHIK